MFKKSLLLLSFFFLCISRLNAQITCSGKMLNAKDSKIENICFLRTPNPIGNISKYTILLSGIEIYEVEFTYYKDGDSILIKFYDKQNTTVKRETVKLKSEDSHYLICDYKPNIKTIQNAEGYRILFGIDHPNQQFITLYQFQAIGGTLTQFKLQDVPDSIISQHKVSVTDYEVIVNIRKRYSQSIEQLKNEMSFHKDSIITSLIDKENAKIDKEATLIADKSLQGDFTKKMDSIFIGYFKNIFSFNEERFDANFTFSCGGNGKIKIDTVKSINFKSGIQKNWLRDSFVLRLKPVIEKGLYGTLTETLTNKTLKLDFANWFDERFNTYTNLGPADKDSFLVSLKNIYADLDPYMVRTINIPTIYSYNFNYTSSIKKPVWKYVKEGDGNDKFIDKSNKENSIEITDDLKQIFHNKYGSLGKDKYNLVFNSIILNNGIFRGQDLIVVGKN